MTYRSPFITETDEPAFTDCQICAGLMLVAEWTAGEAILDRPSQSRHHTGSDHDRPGTGAAGRGQSHRRAASMRGGI